MWNAIANAVLPIAIKFLVTVVVAAIGAATPYLFKMLQLKLGDIRFKRAISAAAYAVKIIVGEFQANTDLSKTASAIIASFEAEVLKIIPGLTQGQLDYLFSSVLSDIIAQLGLDASIFAASTTISNPFSPKKKGLFD